MDALSKRHTFTRTVRVQRTCVYEPRFTFQATQSHRRSTAAIRAHDWQQTCERADDVSEAAAQ